MTGQPTTHETGEARGVLESARGIGSLAVICAVLALGGLGAHLDAYAKLDLEKIPVAYGIAGAGGVFAAGILALIGRWVLVRREDHYDRG